QRESPATDSSSRAAAPPPPCRSLPLDDLAKSLAGRPDAPVRAPSHALGHTLGVQPLRTVPPRLRGRRARAGVAPAVGPRARRASSCSVVRLSLRRHRVVLPSRQG